MEHGINGETLREQIISGIKTEGYYSPDRNPLYASEYIFWREMWKDFRDFVSQCELCQDNKERNPLPVGNAQTHPFPIGIFSSYAIDFMGPFTKLKGPDSGLLVVDIAAGLSYLIATLVTAMAVQTPELLRHYIFTPHGVLPSTVSYADPLFPFKLWKQTLKIMRIQHLLAAPSHYQTNGQAERKIREPKTTLKNIVNLHQTYWPTCLPEVAAYSNTGHSCTINMSHTHWCMVETTPS